MDKVLDEALPPKHCPLLDKTCLEDGCVFWTRSSDSVRKNCAVVVIAQQLNNLVAKGGETRLS